jgi:large subunit ribosomal protein L28
MAKRCEICGKGTTMGRRISHAHNVTNRPIEPNLKRVRATVDGANRTVRVCTGCLRSGRITKPAKRTWRPEEAKG